MVYKQLNSSNSLLKQWQPERRKNGRERGIQNANKTEEQSTHIKWTMRVSLAHIFETQFSYFSYF
jgi:hypothetical protein